MRFLVTGGAGFIGSHLVETLLARGDEVVVLDDFSTGRRKNLEPFGGRITLIEGSIADPAVCEAAVRGVEYVLHQAALGSVPRSVAEPLRTHEVNATGTLNLLDAARRAGVRRVVFAASSSAYGDTEELPKHEAMPVRPRSPYAVSKVTGEAYCRAFHASYGLETVALRYFNVFGPRQDPNSQYAAVVPLFVTSALAGQRPTIFGDGEQSRDFTYIDNVVEANLRACEAGPAALGEVFNIGAGSRTTINELWSITRSLTAAEVEPRYEPSRAGDVRHSLASLERARAALGYDPRIDVVEGLGRTVEWYRAAAQPA
jgi:nucleoside-diphosphate-sugar epimerase